MTDRLYSARYLKEIIDSYGFKITKSLGQNFLIDGNIVRNIVKEAGVGKEDQILEVGPGIGTLTEELSLRAGKVVSIEIDKNLIPILDTTLGKYNNVEVVHGDILQIDINSIIKEKMGGGPVKVVANLPYYVTTPIIGRFLEEDLDVESLTIMVQKEVAERMVAEEGSKTYGSLSVFVNFYSDPEIVLNVPRTVFMPQPNVDSAVIKMTMKKQLPQVDRAKFFKLVKSAFSKRRKTLVNAVSSYGFTIEKGQVNQALESLGIDKRIRAEALSIDQFIKLCKALPDLEMEEESQ